MTNKPLEDAQKANAAEDHEKAVILLSQAIQLEPNNAELYEHRGVAYFKLKDYKNSLADLTKAVNLEPEHGYRYACRAYVKGKSGDPEGAVRDYEKAVEIDPEDAISYNNLGMAQEQLGYARKAMENQKRADELAKKQGLEVPEHPKEEPASDEAPEDDRSHLGVMLDVFRNRRTRGEFLKFIKRGFRNE